MFVSVFVSVFVALFVYLFVSLFVCLFRTSTIGIVFYGYIMCNNMSDIVINEMGKNPRFICTR